jgi:hypothetical protein
MKAKAGTVMDDKKKFLEISHFFSFKKYELWKALLLFSKILLELLDMQTFTP